jgi:branched-chain amino acid transport system substrate-binding protein
MICDQPANMHATTGGGMTCIALKKWFVASGAVIALAFAAGTAQAQNAKPIRIGVLTERSGVLGEMGVQNDVGINLAVKEINAAGGILGRPVEVVIADEQSDPTQAVNEARRLVEREKVDVIYGPIGSQLAMAVLPILREAKVTNISVAGTTSFTTEVAPYGFSLLPSAQAQGQALVDFTYDQLKAKAIGILSDGGGQAKAAAEAMKAYMASRNIRLTSHEEYASGALDMTPQLLSLKRGQPDHLILFAQAGNDTGRVIKNLNEIGWNVPVSGNISVGSGWTSVIPIAGPDAYKNVYSANYKVLSYCSGEAEGASAYAKFVQKVKAAAPPSAAGKLSPLQVSYSYDSINILKAAIEGAKSTAGPAVTAWLEQNANRLTGIQGQFSASKTSHFLLGPDALIMTDRPDKPRSDDLVKRFGC